MADRVAAAVSLVDPGWAAVADWRVIGVSQCSAPGGPTIHLSGEPRRQTARLRTRLAVLSATASRPWAVGAYGDGNHADGFEIMQLNVNVLGGWGIAAALPICGSRPQRLDHVQPRPGSAVRSPMGVDRRQTAPAVSHRRFVAGELPPDERRSDLSAIYFYRQLNERQPESSGNTMMARCGRRARGGGVYIMNTSGTNYLQREGPRRKLFEMFMRASTVSRHPGC